MIVKSARSHPQYLFDNAAPQAGERFASLPSSMTEQPAVMSIGWESVRVGIVSRSAQARIDSAIHERTRRTHRPRGRNRHQYDWIPASLLPMSRCVAMTSALMTLPRAPSISFTRGPC